jgi:hypothetical protein
MKRDLEYARHAVEELLMVSNKMKDSERLADLAIDGLAAMTNIEHEMCSMRQVFKDAIEYIARIHAVTFDPELGEILTKAEDMFGIKPNE